MAGSNAAARSAAETAGITRVRIVSSLAGAGHTQVALALRESLTDRSASPIEVEISDAIAELAPRPWSWTPRIYAGWCVHSPRTWSWLFRATDGPRRSGLLFRLLRPLFRNATHRALTEGGPWDALVSVVPVQNHLLTYAARDAGLDTLVLTMATDPISAHASWMAPKIDALLVGSEEAGERAVEIGVPAQRVRVTGQPVNPRFVEQLCSRKEARAILGWDDDAPAILLVGGGEGMSNIERHAIAIDARCRGVQLAVVAGRNRRLARRLRERVWENPTRVFDLVDHVAEMSKLMSASDLLVTKSGPGTLHDAYLAGLPLVLCGAIPLQEDGNVRQVVEAGAGVFATDPETVAGLAHTLLGEDHVRLSDMAARSRALARPDAAAHAADAILDTIAAHRAEARR